MKTKKIFISYRRVDSPAFARLIYDRLSTRFGEENIFMDVEGLDPGVDFVDALEIAVSSCKVLVALIGTKWLVVADESGKRRLDNPEDFVRLEIAAALDRDVRVIPILVQGARMPGSKDLPKELNHLARLNALEIRHERFNADVTRLVRAIEKFFNEENEYTGRRTTDQVAKVQERVQKQHKTAELRRSLAVHLSPIQETVKVGDKVVWIVVCRNDGDDDLRQITFNRGRTLIGKSFDLAVGEEREFSFTTTYRVEGKKTVEVVTTGTGSNNVGVRNTTRATVQVQRPKPVRESVVPLKKSQLTITEVITITSPIPMELIRIPAGEFLMGSKKKHSKQVISEGASKEFVKHEQPQHPVQVAEFYIGKFPVTNVQFDVFVKSVNRILPRLGKGKLPKSMDQVQALKLKHLIHSPNHWKKGQIPKGQEEHPVVNISWSDAVAFCRWLSEKTGELFRLPTEAEWEKAARGTDGRIYPWGNEWYESQLNYGKTQKGLIGFFSSATIATTAVGQFLPGGDSPYGCSDMVGNVWEWTLSKHYPYPYNPQDGRNDLEGKERRVVRGGSWKSNHWDARCASRPPRMHSWNPDLGFRVVMTTLVDADPDLPIDNAKS